MQTTLRIDDEIYREAKAEAARAGMTLTRYIQEALKAYLTMRRAEGEVMTVVRKEVAERNALMEALLQETAHFRIGEHPGREEIHGR